MTTHAIFDMQITVELAHINVLGHVDDVTYMQWIQEAANQHNAALGLGLQEYIKLKHAMLASEHQIQRRKPLFLHDKIILRTWLDCLDTLHSTRQHAIYRVSDQSIVFIAKSKWACVEIATGRTKRMSQSFVQAYQPLSSHINPLDFGIAYAKN